MNENEIIEMMNRLKAESTDVRELPEVATLTGVTSLPAVKGEELVRVPLTLMDKGGRADIWRTFGQVEVAAVPALVEKGAVATVTVTWKASIKNATADPAAPADEKTVVLKNGVVVAGTAQPLKDKVAGDTTYVVAVTRDDDTKRGTATVTAVDPVFAGGVALETLTGTDVAKLTKKVGYAEGDYTIELKAAGYLWLCCPVRADGGESVVGRVKFASSQGGFDIPFVEAARAVGVAVASGAVDYRCFRCAKKQVAGRYEVKVY